MSTKFEIFKQTQIKKDLPNLRPGDFIRVHQKIKEGNKERIQIFEGLIIARKHGKEIGATITVRKIISGIGVEKIFPIHSPNIEKIEIIRSSKIRRAKLYYLREKSTKKIRKKLKKENKNIVKPTIEEKESVETDKRQIQKSAGVVMVAEQA